MTQEEKFLVELRKKIEKGDNSLETLEELFSSFSKMTAEINEALQVEKTKQELDSIYDK